MSRIPAKNRRPVAPGRIFFKQVLEPLGLSQREAAERLRISYPRMNEIVNGKRAVTPETALRLARFSGTRAEYWLDLQQAVDLWEAVHAREGMDDIRKVEPAVDAGSRRAERYGVVRVFALGDEPPDEPLDGTSAQDRLRMAEELTRQSWALADSSVTGVAQGSAGGAEAIDGGEVR